jgi:hypothetical protein
MVPRYITAILARQAAFGERLLVVRVPGGGHRCRAERRADQAAAMPSDQEGDDRHEESSGLTIQSLTAKDVETVNASSGGVETAARVTSLRRGVQSWMLSLFRQSPGAAASASIAALFAAAYLLAPPMGRDLAAQLSSCPVGRTLA